MFAMIADHLGGDSWLYAVTGGNHSFISAAEGFVFISGLVMGQAYGSKIQRLGLKSAIEKALLRARTLYLVTVVLTLTFSTMRLYTDLALWVPRTFSPGAESLPDLLVGALTLHLTYHGTDILALYVFCVLAAAIGLTALAFGKWRWVLGASWLTWLGHQFKPALQVPWYVRNSENFPFAAWQGAVHDRPGHRLSRPGPDALVGAAASAAHRVDWPGSGGRHRGRVFLRYLRRQRARPI